MKLNKKLMAKVESTDIGDELVTDEEITAESERLGVPKLEIYQFLMNHVIKFHFTNKGY